MADTHPNALLIRGEIAECWVVPYDQSAFDRIWRGATDSPPLGCAIKRVEELSITDHERRRSVGD